MIFIGQLRKTQSENNAIKEALDHLPSAVCYFTPYGNIKLCNTAMYEIYQTITGRDLQSYNDLKEVLGHPEKAIGIKRDGNVFLFPDGRARQYYQKEIRTEEGRRYIEAVFSDVTELYRKQKELEKQSDELKKMYEELKILSGQLMEVTREEEILNMKTRLHDQMNMGITAIRQVLRQNTTSEENAAAIARFRRAILVLRDDTIYPQDDFNEFIHDAEVAGVSVNLSGSLPEKRDCLTLAVEIMREACINAVRHADATVLNILSEATQSSVTMRITNDGNPPKKEITPQGGLKDLKKRTEDAGGSMEILSRPEFVLTVRLPVNREEKGEETQA